MTTAQNIAELVADCVNAAEQADVVVVEFTPSVVFTRAFLGVKVGDKQYLITIEEA